VWEPLVVNLGFRPSSLLGEEFLSAPIHSPSLVAKSVLHYIPRAAERSLPFFQILKSSKNFQWSETQKQAFQELKYYLSNMTKLCPPKPRSPLLLYVSASNSAVNTVLVQEKEEERKFKQIPLYFASEALSGLKIFYSEL
jgi:hypothetical protein